MLIHNLLENAAEKYSDKRAVWDRNIWYDYAYIEINSNKLANYLWKSGICRGDRVAILMQNSIDYIIAYFAILKIGGITVELNTQITKNDFIYYINHSQTKVVITTLNYLKYILPAINETPSLKEVIVKNINKTLSDYNIKITDLLHIYKGNEAQRPDVKIIDIDVASIVYTSGSTGKPKGVTLSHLNFISNTRSIVQYLKLNIEDSILVVLPFYYIYGKSLLHTHFHVGGSLVIDNRFAYPSKVLDTMESSQVTGFAGVPSTFMILLNKTDVAERKFPNLRYLTQAGGPMAPSIQKRVAEIFKPAKLFIMYGATEASARLSYLEPDLLDKKLGSIGKAIPNVELFIADEDGKALPPNKVGQIVARGSNIMQGYWNDSEETKKVLKNNLYFTGDLGYMDEDGFLYVVGRLRDIIKVGGNRVSAKEIEEVILEMEEVSETAIVGIEDAILGEAIKAFVVLKNGKKVDKDFIINYCKKKLPGYKVPHYIEFRKELPKNSSGKILKSELKNSKIIQK